MSSKAKRLKKTALETPPPALATVAVGAAAPVGRQARRRGVGAVVKAGIESAVVVGTGIGIGGETVEKGSVVTAAVAGIVDIVVSPEVGTGGVRIVFATGVHHLPLGAGMDTVKVLISERRAQSGSPLII